MTRYRHATIAECPFLKVTWVIQSGGFLVFTGEEISGHLEPAIYPPSPRVMGDRTQDRDACQVS